jgi:hypothetical protein
MNHSIQNIINEDSEGDKKENNDSDEKILPLPAPALHFIQERFPSVKVRVELACISCDVPELRSLLSEFVKNPNSGILRLIRTVEQTIGQPIAFDRLR